MWQKQAVVFLLSLWIFACAQEACPKGLNRKNKEDCCENFYNKISKAQARSCCLYPQFVIYRWKHEQCCNECKIEKEAGKSQNRCCELTCCLKHLNVIGVQPNVNEINTEGLKYSFFLSVNNDTRWEEVISSTVDMCTSKFRQKIPSISNTTSLRTFQEYDNHWDCYETVPKYLYNIIDCIYYQNFLSCPVFKTDDYLCPKWKTYVQDCLIEEN